MRGYPYFNKAPLMSAPSNPVGGFTLIELMITVVIVAILASIAVPSYTDYITRSRIAEATSGLASKRVRLEAYYDNNRTYVGAPDCASDTATSANFTFSCSAATASSYTIQAVGRNAMSGFTYTIDQANAKATSSVPTGWTSSTTCWVLNRGGSC